MKKVMVFMVAITLGLATTLSAKKLPAVAAKLPSDFKTEIAKHLDYPKYAQDNMIEGEVWMRVTLDEKSAVRIVDLSATNPELGAYVKEELSELTVKSQNFKAGTVYFMKVKFDLIK